MLTKKDIQLLREVFFEPINNQFKEIRTILEDHNRRIMSLQDTVVGIDKYLNGELKIFLHRLDKDRDRYAAILSNHEKRLKAVSA